MVGLLVAGLALARRFGTGPGIALRAAAAAVKAPAFLESAFDINAASVSLFVRLRRTSDSNRVKYENPSH
jgi:hypothetical protein